ncbi:MAG TPA: hypothetical protein VF548_05030 [Allosphingosinicella sp.]|jgi:hypothetical protein
MSVFLRVLLSAAALGLAAAPAAAQDSPQPSDAADILVTGQNVDDQIKDFVGALTQAPPRGQLSRFETKVCPTAFGLQPGQRDAVLARMRVVAKAAGLDVGKPGCIPNILLIVTPNKRAFIEALDRKYDFYFGEMSNGDVRRLARSPGPAAVWQVQGPELTGDGDEASHSGDGALPGADYAVNRTTRPQSRVSASGRPQFQAAAVVIEQGALDGLTTIQLADYAAMRAFARTDPAKLPASSPATILKVLETPMGSPVPLTLTKWDLSFLKGLYAATGNLYATSQRSEIKERIERDLKGEAAESPKRRKK